VKPEAARQFDILKAEVSGNGKDKGPALIAKVLNLLFKKHGKPPLLRYSNMALFGVGVLVAGA
jgi:hypothetical protein